MTTKTEDMQRGLLEIMRRFQKGAYVPLVASDGLTPSEARVIIAIHMARLEGIGRIQPRVLSERMHMTPSALSQTLKVLEEKGCVERNRVSEDFRAVSLELTERGSLLASEAYRVRHKHLEDLIEYVGVDDVEHLLITLNKMVDFHEQQAKAGTMERVEHICACSSAAQEPSNKENRKGNTCE